MTIPRARLISFLLTAAAPAVFWTAPVFATLREHLSGSTMVTTMIPLALACLALVFRPLKLSAAVMLLVFSYIAGMSIGLLYLPGAIVMFFPEPPPKTPAS